MLALNLLLITLFVLGIIGGATWWFVIRPLTRKVVNVCDKRDEEKKVAKQDREEAERDYERLMKGE